MISKLMILTLFLLSCYSQESSKLLRIGNDPLPPELNFAYTPTEHQFTQQILDHFDYHQNETFSQRYWAINDYFDQQQGPVFLVLCDRIACTGLNQKDLFILELAHEFNALIIVLEHRFYGESQPFTGKNLTIEQLKYLNIDQTLADIAYFINWAKTSNNFAVNLTENTPFITIGKSYTGALSAWFREKYPYLTIGAIGSSATINSIVDFWQFDYQLYNSLVQTPLCAQNVQALNRYVENQLQDHDYALNIKQKFNATDLTDQEFLWLWADATANPVLHGGRTFICEMLAAHNTLELQIEVIKDIAKDYLDPKRYSVKYLSDLGSDNEERQKAWQTCSELGWFQTAPWNETYALRSQQLNLEFYREWCADIFEEGVFPTANITNLKFGGADIDTYNLIISNGAEDPWQKASLIDSRNSIDVFYIDCENCAHSADLKTPRKDDPWALWWERLKIKGKIAQWLSDTRGNIFSGFQV